MKVSSRPLFKIAILTISVGGLEVYYEPEDRWCPVKYIPDAYVVNIGDMMGMDPVHMGFIAILTISSDRTVDEQPLQINSPPRYLAGLGKGSIQHCIL